MKGMEQTPNKQSAAPQIRGIYDDGKRPENLIRDYSPEAVEQKLKRILDVIRTPLDNALNNASLGITPENLNANYFVTLDKETLVELSAVISSFSVDFKFVVDREQAVKDVVDEIVELVVSSNQPKTIH